jgi:nitrogen fixation protein FixH
MGISAQLKNDLKNPWLRGILGVVAVTVGVNLAYILYAFWSPPNLVAKDYYERGQNYFHEEIKREQEAGDAWRLQLLAPDKPKMNLEQDYRLYVMDHEGRAVNSGKAVLFAYRPDDSRRDFRQELHYADTGTYAATLRFPLPGKWDLIAQIRSGEQKFDVAQRINVEK